MEKRWLEQLGLHRALQTGHPATTPLLSVPSSPFLFSVVTSVFQGSLYLRAGGFYYGQLSWDSLFLFK